MDVLGDVLLSLRLLAGRIGILNFGCPWGLASPTHPPHLVVGMTLLDGPFWLQPEGEPPIRLQPGDTALLLSGARYRSMSDPAAQIVRFEHFAGPQGMEQLTLGRHPADPPEQYWREGAERTRMLHFGLIAQDGGPTAVLMKLRRTMVIPSESGQRPAWLGGVLGFLATDDPARPGYAAAAARHVELIFTSLLREHLLAGGAPGPNWVSGLRDPRLGRALAGIHARPEAPWTVESLAREAGMARSTFARRFVELIGQSPIDYLIAHRMQWAFGRMAADRQSVAAVAESLGYRSERAFRQAFKAHFGESPTHYLKQAG